MSTYLVCLIRFGDSHFCSFVMVLSCLCILVSRNCHGLKEHLHVTRRQGSLSQGSARRQQASTLSLGTQCSFALRVLVLFALQCRIGEAMVPGPSQFEVGVCNPSGLPTKAHLLDAQNADIWLVSETHLTVEGLRAFKSNYAAVIRHSNGLHMVHLLYQERLVVTLVNGRELPAFPNTPLGS